MHPRILRVRSALLGLVCLLPCAGLGAYTYDIAAAPALILPKAGLVAAPLAGSVSLSATAFYLAPFRDLRRDKDLWKGDSSFQQVDVDAKGLDGQAKSWRQDDYGSESFLWQRQLGQALAKAGFRVFEASAPFADPRDMAGAARQAGASVLLDGEILQLTIDKRGADGFFGTNFRGTNYTFNLKVSLHRTSLGPVGKNSEQDWNFSHVFHDTKSMGRRDGDTFPVYFKQGLSMAAQALGDDPGFRSSLGLPVLLPGASAAPVGKAARSYWVNPKTGKRMAASWNFDPADGTPRKDFVQRWEIVPHGNSNTATALSQASGSTPTARSRP